MKNELSSMRALVQSSPRFTARDLNIPADALLGRPAFRRMLKRSGTGERVRRRVWNFTGWAWTFLRRRRPGLPEILLATGIFYRRTLLKKQKNCLQGKGSQSRMRPLSSPMTNKNGASQ
jgi:hypothetical protein